MRLARVISNIKKLKKEGRKSARAANRTKRKKCHVTRNSAARLPPPAGQAGRAAARAGGSARASALARSPLPPVRVSEAAAPPAVSERALQQALLALDADNRVLRRKLADAGTAAKAAWRVSGV